MPHSRISFAGALRLHVRNSAVYSSETQPQRGGGLRPRRAAPHPSYVSLPPPLQVRRCVARGSRRHWGMVFPELQGDGNRVPPRIESYS